MPSTSFTPTTLVLAGANISTIPEVFGFLPTRLTITAGAFEAGPSTESNRTATSVKLPRLQRQFPISTPEGFPTENFHGDWQKLATTIEQAFALDRENISENTRILGLIKLAIGLAENANAKANETQAANALQNSYTDPVAVLSATSSGTIGVAAHERVYADGTRVSVGAGSLSGFSSGENVTVFYGDPAREGGAVTFQATTNAVAQTGATHIVGQVTIPASGEPNVSGYGPTAPGYTPRDTYGSDGGRYEV